MQKCELLWETKHPESDITYIKFKQQPYIGSLYRNKI